MWTLYLTAKTYSQRPSDLVQIDDPWIAIQFDNAVAFLGIAIENASQEMEKRGSGKDIRSEPKYTMKQLLDPSFRLPNKDGPEEESIDSFMSKIKGVHGLDFTEVG